MSLDDILPSGNKKNANTKKVASQNPLEKEKHVVVNFSHAASTKKMLDELVWLKKFVVDMKEASQGDIIREGLELLAKKIGYKDLRMKYAEQLENAKPKAGRKKR